MGSASLQPTSAFELMKGIMYCIDRGSHFVEFLITLAEVGPTLPSCPDRELLAAMLDYFWAFLVVQTICSFLSV